VLNKVNEPDTIADFGSQWTKFRSNPGYYGSDDILENLLGPLIPLKSLKGKKICDVGAGTGRYTRMLYSCNPSKIIAIEPSAAFGVLKENVAGLKNVECLQLPADKIPLMDFDFVFCAGVLQFIPDQFSALKAMGKSLGPNGQIFLWVYGQENNDLYLKFIKPLRKITSRLSHEALEKLSTFMLIPACLYSFLCKYMPLPLSSYIREYFSRMDNYSKKLIIFDQLNPKTARYYRKEELIDILKYSGFYDIRIHHHLGYSWSVLARYDKQVP